MLIQECYFTDYMYSLHIQGSYVELVNKYVFDTTLSTRIKLFALLYHGRF